MYSEHTLRCNKWGSSGKRHDGMRDVSLICLKHAGITGIAKEQQCGFPGKLTPGDIFVARWGKDGKPLAGDYTLEDPLCKSHRSALEKGGRKGCFTVCQLADRKKGFEVQQISNSVRPDLFYATLHDRHRRNRAKYPSILLDNTVKNHIE